VAGVQQAEPAPGLQVSPLARLVVAVVVKPRALARVLGPGWWAPPKRASRIAPVVGRAVWRVAVRLALRVILQVMARAVA
jgi:hypothetical protein